MKLGPLEIDDDSMMYTITLVAILYLLLFVVGPCAADGFKTSQLNEQKLREQGNVYISGGTWIKLAPTKEIQAEQK